TRNFRRRRGDALASPGRGSLGLLTLAHERIHRSALWCRWRFLPHRSLRLFRLRPGDSQGLNQLRLRPGRRQFFLWLLGLIQLVQLRLFLFLLGLLRQLLDDRLRSFARSRFTLCPGDRRGGGLGLRNLLRLLLDLLGLRLGLRLAHLHLWLARLGLRFRRLGVLSFRQLCVVPANTAVV